MTPERRCSLSPRIQKIKAASLDESFEVTLASDAESDEDESPEKQNVYMSPRGVPGRAGTGRGRTTVGPKQVMVRPRETDGETGGEDGGDPGEDTGQTEKGGGDPGGGGEVPAADDKPRPQTIRVQVLGDDDTESDSEVTAEIMDVTKSITQQILDNATKDKQEVQKYSTLDSAYDDFGYNQQISLHQNHSLQC